MSENTGSTEPIRVKAGEQLVFKVNKSVPLDRLSEWAKLVDQRLPGSVFISDEIELYAVIEP